MLTSHSVVHHPFPPPFFFFLLCTSDVQARPRCRDDRIPGYDYYDLHLGLCAPQFHSVYQ